MAEKVIIRVSTDGAKKTLQELSSIKSKVDELNKSSVSINLNTGSSGKGGGGGSATKEVQDLSGRVAELTKGMRIAKETTTEFSNAATKNAKQYTDDMKRMVTVTEQGNRTMIQSTQKYEKVLTDQAKAAHTAEVQSKALSNAYGDLIDHQEKIVDGQVVQAMNKYRDAAGNVTTITAKLDGETVKVSTSIKSASEETKKMADNAELAAKRNSLLGDSLDRIVAKIVAWQVINAAVASTIRSFKEALQTMKAVDTELVQVRKVTGFTADEMKRVEEQAYKTASAYGVAADAYLESVAAFARAGYKERSTELAELSTKTQIVGDTTAEIANQFLLSVDAAYQYKGSIEELTKVLDGANEIDNKYATSIEKIAEGMGIVAPVAKQVNVGVDELAAAIGTITAVTQRSGSEAARALRAIFLNIVGDTKTEIDEGVTWTTGEIAGLQDVIKLYAKDAYDAAKATGEVLNPMEAIAGLAQSMKDGVLTADKLTQMVSDIGGKLRTSQLLAIIQNWDMYQSMLQDYAGAIGSADREVENALDSWERKTMQLKNAWTEFISHIVDTKGIKVGIDVLTTAVKLLDSQFGKAAVTAGLLIGAFAALNKVTQGQLLSSLQTLVKYFLGVRDAEILAAGGAAALNAAFLSIGIVAFGAAVYALYQHLNKISKEYETQKKALEEIESKYTDNVNELKNIKSRTDELTDAEKERLAVLELENYELDKQLQKQREQTFDAWRQSQTRRVADDTGGTGNAFNFGTHIESITVTELNNAKTALMALDAEWENGQHSQKGYNDGLKAIAASLKKSAENIKIGQQAGKELSDEESALLTLYEYLVEKISEYTDETRKNTDAKNDNDDATNGAAEANEALKNALDEVDKKGSLTYGTLEELDALYPGLSKRILDANGNLTAEGQAAMSTQGAFLSLIGQMVAFNNTGLDVSGKILQLQALARQAGVTGASILAAIGASDVSAAVEEYMLNGTSRDEAEAQVLNDYYNSWSRNISSYYKKQDYIIPPGGGSGGSTQTPQEKHLAELKQAVEDAKARYTLSEAMGANSDWLAMLSEDVQKALQDEANYLDEIGAEYSDIASIVKEKLDWQKKTADAAAKEAEEAAKSAEDAQKALDDAQKEELQKHKDNVSFLKQELAFLEASGATDEEIIAKQKEIQRALHDEAEYMRSIKADEKDIKALSTEWWEIQNKIQSVLDKTAETLKKEVKETIDDIIGQLQEQSDARVSALQAEIDLLKEQHDVVADTREEEEKRLAVEESRIALENAQNERTVRQYNAKSGQWEWVANAKNVQAAQEELAKSEAALQTYLAEQDYKKKLAELEAQKEETKSVFETVKDAMNKFSDAVAKILESPKLDANAKKKFVDDITDILTSPVLEGHIKPNFIQGITEILTSPTLSEKVKTDFISNITSVLTAPTLSDNVKKAFINNVTTVLTAPTLDTSVKTSFINGVSSILTSPTLPAKTKEKFINDITNILTAPTLTDKAKQTILNNLAALLNNSDLKAETKTQIASAMAALVGNAKDAESAVGTFSKYIENALKTKNPETAIGQLYDAIMSGVVDINDIGTILAALNGEYASISTDAAKMLALSKMQANSIAWHMTEDKDTREALHAENESLGKKLGLTYNSSKGTWNDASGNQVYTLSNIGGNWLSELNDKIAYVQDLIANASKNSASNSGSSYSSGASSSSGSSSSGTSSASTSATNTKSKIAKVQAGGKAPAGLSVGDQVVTGGGTYVITGVNADGSYKSAKVEGGATTATFKGTYDVYDSGGVLHGLGGIKATREDEMVLPPDATKAMLNAEASGAFNALLNHLGIVTAAANQIAGFGGGAAPNSIGEQNNGDSYNFGNISLSEQQAKGMTVYQLAQLGRTLALQRGN